MIGSADASLLAFFREGLVSKDIPNDLTKSLFRRLQMLDDATCDADLRSPPGNHFEKLGGQLTGKCSIRVNKKWRLIFEFDDNTGIATGVYLDPHTYR